MMFTMVQRIYPYKTEQILSSPCLYCYPVLSHESYLFAVEISNLTPFLNVIWRPHWRMPTFIVTICMALMAKLLNLLRCFPIPMGTIIYVQSFEFFRIFYYLSPVDIFIVKGTQITKYSMNETILPCHFPGFSNTISKQFRYSTSWVWREKSHLITCYSGIRLNPEILLLSWGMICPLPLNLVQRDHSRLHKQIYFPTAIRSCLEEFR